MATATFLCSSTFPVPECKCSEILSPHYVGYRKLQYLFSIMPQLLFGGTLAAAQMSWGDGTAARAERGERDLALTFVSSFPHD